MHVIIARSSRYTGRLADDGHLHLVVAGQVRHDVVVLHALDRVVHRVTLEHGKVLDRVAFQVALAVDAQVELAALNPLEHRVVHQAVRAVDAQVVLVVAMQVALYVAHAVQVELAVLGRELNGSSGRT